MCASLPKNQSLHIAATVYSKSLEHVIGVRIPASQPNSSGFQKATEPQYFQAFPPGNRNAFHRNLDFSAHSQISSLFRAKSDDCGANRAQETFSEQQSESPSPEDAASAARLRSPASSIWAGLAQKWPLMAASLK
jgi:hypothetical protein